MSGRRGQPPATGFPPYDALSSLCASVVSSPAFNVFILLAIILGGVTPGVKTYNVTLGRFKSNRGAELLYLERVAAISQSMRPEMWARLLELRASLKTRHMGSAQQ